MNYLNNYLPMSTLINKLSIDFPNIHFKLSDSYYWSPRKNTVHYRKNIDSEKASWPILHELGHAVLEHKSFKSDFELIKMEIDAWQKAKELALKYNYSIEEEHIQDCLDTYRDWLYKRSTCPWCTSSGLQIESNLYRCLNCNNTWQVSASRKCRTYRKLA